MDNEFWQLLGQLIIVLSVLGGIMIGLVVAEAVYESHKIKRVNDRINGIDAHKMRQSPDE